jgi:hypothetical protein
MGYEMQQARSQQAIGFVCFTIGLGQLGFAFVLVMFKAQ